MVDQAWEVVAHAVPLRLPWPACEYMTISVQRSMEEEIVCNRWKLRLIVCMLGKSHIHADVS